MKKIFTTLSLAATSVASVLAQTGTTINVNTTGATVGQVNAGPLTNLLKLASSITGMLAPILISLAVLAFFWFLVEFIWKGRDDAEAKKRGLSGMGYAILALFLMVSVWGVIGWLGNIVGVGQGGSIPIPSVPVLQ